MVKGASALQGFFSDSGILLKVVLQELIERLEVFLSLL
jgi:hypothetical protein